MKRLAAAAAILCCAAFMGNAHAFKTDQCVMLIHEAIEKNQQVLAGPADRLSQVLQQTKVSSRAVQFYEASLLERAAQNVSLRLQMLTFTSNLVHMQSNDKAKYQAGLVGLDDSSQGTFKIIELRVKEADLTLKDISDRQLRSAAQEVVTALKKLSAIYSPCIH